MEHEHPEQISHLDNITITPFRFKHMKHLIDMHESQGYSQIETINYRTLPKIGYIAFNGKIPIAAGFLRRLEPCYGQIDTLVTNRYAGAILRNNGINKVVDSIIEEAKKIKLEGIVCHTQDKSTLARAESLGFHIVPQTIIALPLNQECK